MPKIDAHQHFWKYDPVIYGWINEEMQILRQDLLPENLYPLLQQHHFDGCIVVQADQSETETLFQLENAQRYDFIRGVVGWVDLQAGNLNERLQYFQQFSQLKGFRHVLQDEQQRGLMLQPAFMQGVSQLKSFGFTYDILIHQDQLQYVPQFVGAFPEQAFVLDHLAKPDIKNKQIADWKLEIAALGAYSNLYCKVSGMVTEADWKFWKYEDFVPYLDVVFEVFGVERLMFGSDWPVSTLAASYQQWVQVLEKYMAPFPEAEKALFWGDNAVRFYKLNQR